MSHCNLAIKRHHNAKYLLVCALEKPRKNAHSDQCIFIDSLVNHACRSARPERRHNVEDVDHGM